RAGGAAEASRRRTRVPPVRRGARLRQRHRPPLRSGGGGSCLAALLRLPVEALQLRSTRSQRPVFGVTTSFSVLTLPGTKAAMKPPQAQRSRGGPSVSAPGFTATPA